MTGPIKDRMLKLAPLVSVQNAERTTTPAGENPDDIESDDTIVYGDNVIPMFKEVRTRCMSPARFPNDCVYDATARGEEYRRCKYCRKLTG